MSERTGPIDNTPSDAELREQLWDLAYGLLEPAETEALESLIRRDPEVARLYADTVLQSQEVAAAARLHNEAVELTLTPKPAPVPQPGGAGEVVTSAPTHRFGMRRAMTALVAAAAAVLLFVSAYPLQLSEPNATALARQAPRMIVAGPAEVISRENAPYHLTITSSDQQPLGNYEVRYELRSDKGQSLAQGAITTNDTGEAMVHLDTSEIEDRADLVFFANDSQLQFPVRRRSLDNHRSKGDEPSEDDAGLAQQSIPSAAPVDSPVSESPQTLEEDRSLGDDLADAADKRQVDPNDVAPNEMAPNDVTLNYLADSSRDLEEFGTHFYDQPKNGAFFLSASPQRSDQPVVADLYAMDDNGDWLAETPVVVEAEQADGKLVYQLKGTTNEVGAIRAHVPTTAEPTARLRMRRADPSRRVLVDTAVPVAKFSSSSLALKAPERLEQGIEAVLEFKVEGTDAKKGVARLLSSEGELASVTSTDGSAQVRFQPNPGETYRGVWSAANGEVLTADLQPNVRSAVGERHEAAAFAGESLAVVDNHQESLAAWERLWESSAEQVERRRRLAGYAGLAGGGALCLLAVMLAMLRLGSWRVLMPALAVGAISASFCVRWVQDDSTQDFSTVRKRLESRQQVAVLSEVDKDRVEAEEAAESRNGAVDAMRRSGDSLSVELDTAATSGQAEGTPEADSAGNQPSASVDSAELAQGVAEGLSKLHLKDESNVQPNEVRPNDMPLSPSIVELQSFPKTPEPPNIAVAPPAPANGPRGVAAHQDAKELEALNVRSAVDRSRKSQALPPVESIQQLVQENLAREEIRGKQLPDASDPGVPPAVAKATAGAPQLDAPLKALADMDLAETGKPAMDWPADAEVQLGQPFSIAVAHQVPEFAQVRQTKERLLTRVSSSRALVTAATNDSFEDEQVRLGRPSIERVPAAVFPTAEPKPRAELDDSGAIARNKKSLPSGHYDVALDGGAQPNRRLTLAVQPHGFPRVEQTYLKPHETWAWQLPADATFQSATLTVLPTQQSVVRDAIAQMPTPRLGLHEETQWAALHSDALENLVSSRVSDPAFAAKAQAAIADSVQRIAQYQKKTGQEIGSYAWLPNQHSSRDVTTLTRNALSEISDRWGFGADQLALSPPTASTDAVSRAIQNGVSSALDEERSQLQQASEESLPLLQFAGKSNSDTTIRPLIGSTPLTVHRNGHPVAELDVNGDSLQPVTYQWTKPPTSEDVWSIAGGGKDWRVRAELKYTMPDPAKSDLPMTLLATGPAQAKRGVPMSVKIQCVAGESDVEQVVVNVSLPFGVRVTTETIQALKRDEIVDDIATSKDGQLVRMAWQKIPAAATKTVDLSVTPQFAGQFTGRPLHATSNDKHAWGDPLSVKVVK